MSTIVGYPLNYTKPRTIWSLGFQLFYSILGMLPLYYYLREILELPAEGKYLLQFLPVATGILLFFIQLKINEYYWYKEKFYKKRDIVKVVLKSLSLSLFLFYLLFFYIFAYLTGNSAIEEQLGISDNISIVLIELSVTLLIISVIMVMMLGIQNYQTNVRKLVKRIRRR